MQDDVIDHGSARGRLREEPLLVLAVLSEDVHRQRLSAGAHVGDALMEGAVGDNREYGAEDLLAHRGVPGAYAGEDRGREIALGGIARAADLELRTGGDGVVDHLREARVASGVHDACEILARA